MGVSSMTAERSVVSAIFAFFEYLCERKIVDWFCDFGLRVRCVWGVLCR